MMELSSRWSENRASQTLLSKIKSRSATVGILGIGYVGQALAQATSSVGFKTIGFDIDRKKVSEIKKRGVANFNATQNFSRLSSCGIVVICVPTPLTEDRQPDLTALIQATEAIAHHLHRDELVILESSVAPGTTKHVILKILEKRGLRAEKDFFLAVSPERIDPGNHKFTIENTPRVVGGIGQYSTKLASLFYRSFVKKVHIVSSPEVAEMSKMLENTFRLVNISLVNELSEYVRALGVNIIDVISAASTKPFAFLPHYPSPGVGGHCIPVDPYYLLDSPQKFGAKLPLIREALKVNEERPRKVVERALEILNGNASNPKILLVGLSYKKDSEDVRESASLKIWHEAERRGARITYHDPYVPRFNGARSVRLTKKTLKSQDLVIIATDHGNLPYGLFAEIRTPILDTRHTLPNNPLPHIHYV